MSYGHIGVFDAGLYGCGALGERASESEHTVSSVGSHVAAGKKIACCEFSEHTYSDELGLEHGSVITG